MVEKTEGLESRGYNINEIKDMRYQKKESETKKRCWLLQGRGGRTKM